MERLTIIRDFVPGLVDAEEGEIVDRFESSLLGTVDCVRLQWLALEFFLAIEFDCIGHIVVPNPVADPVSVAGPDKDGNARLHDLRQSGQE